MTNDDICPSLKRNFPIFSSPSKDCLIDCYKNSVYIRGRLNKGNTKKGNNFTGRLNSLKEGCMENSQVYS